MKNQVNIKQNDLIKFINSKNYIITDSSEFLTNFNSIDRAKKGDISFISTTNSTTINQLNQSKASLIICHIKLKKFFKNKKCSVIFVNEPRLWFLRCLKKFSSITSFQEIDPTSIINTKKIGKNFSIGPFCYISKNVIIGNNVQIFGNVFIHENVKIGNNVIINSSTVIGSDGFSYERNSGMKLEKFPHIGGVKINDDVEIGSNTCIDKGTLKNTVIGKGTKIDNLVHIAHNVTIGDNCCIVANSLIAGSCVVGNNVYVSMSCTIRDKIRIGDNAILGMGSVVVKDVPKNTTVYGVPAKSK